jgi:hypothetical protein
MTCPSHPCTRRHSSRGASSDPAARHQAPAPTKWTRPTAGARMKNLMESALKPGQLVRVNLAGIQVESVTFHAAVTDAVGNIVKQISEAPPKYLVRLLFSFRGINEVEVPADRIRADSRRRRDRQECPRFSNINT